MNRRAPGSGEPRPIQIWTPTDDGWERPPAGRLGDHHAATRILRPKAPDGPPRVILAGESVAAGYLYAPAYTPARVLAALLPRHEVIDLAKVNESLTGLIETVEAATQLEPDIVVVWAGNNWMLRDLAGLSPYHPDATHRLELADAFDEAGTDGATALARGALDATALPLLADLHSLTEGTGARLVIVVPEVDLDCPVEQPATWWDDTGASQTDSEPTTALRRDAIGRASGALRGSIAPPMATQAVQELLRTWATSHGHVLVDVPALAAAGRDRHWFLDYCHHTAAGIESVVRAIATAIDPDAATRSAPVPTARSRAVAALGAAVHTAHTMVAIESDHRRNARIAALVDLARRTWPGTDDLIGDLVESRLTAAPPILHPATARLADVGFGFAHGIRPVGLDAVLVHCLDVDVTPDQWHARGRDRTPAIELWSSGGECWVHERHRPGAASAETPVLLRSIRATTDLVLPPGTVAHHVELTLRLPEPGRVALHFPGGSARADVGDRWTIVDIAIPPDGILRPRRLHIAWPAPRRTKERRADALASLRRDEPTALHPTFGEILAVRIRPA